MLPFQARGGHSVDARFWTLQDNLRTEGIDIAAGMWYNDGVIQSKDGGGYGGENCNGQST